MTCCRLLLRGQFETLPFRRVIATGFYDGPTEGFTECSRCGQAFSFHMLDWDDIQDVRVFAFCPISMSLDAVSERLRTPLTADAEFSLVAPLGEDDGLFVRELMTRPATRVAAFRGWPAESATCRDISRTDIGQIGDWFSFLDLPGRSAR
jgi:hypothetical protein